MAVKKVVRKTKVVKKGGKSKSTSSAKRVTVKRVTKVSKSSGGLSLRQKKILAAILGAGAVGAGAAGYHMYKNKGSAAPVCGPNKQSYVGWVKDKYNNFVQKYFPTKAAAVQVGAVSVSAV